MVQAGHVRCLEAAGTLPYPSESFDVVLANMVFEHVQDLDSVLENLRRVLKPSGHVLAHFPTLEVFREGHIGIPFAHRFRKDSRLRRVYTRMLRRLGLGYFKEKARGVEAWTDLALSWIDRYCHYRPLSEVRRALQGRFAVSFNEMPYMRFRAGERAWLRRLLACRAWHPCTAGCSGEPIHGAGAPPDRQGAARRMMSDARRPSTRAPAGHAEAWSAPSAILNGQFDHPLRVGPRRSRAGQLAALALFTRLLDEREYGQYTLVFAGVALGYALLLQWLSQGVLRLAAPNAARRGTFLATVSRLFRGLLLVTAVVLAIGIGWSAGWHRVALMAAGIGLLVAQSWQDLNLNLATADELPFRYAWLSAARAVGSFGLGGLAAWAGWGASGVVVGVALGGLIPGFWAYHEVWRPHREARADPHIRHELLRYGLPLAGALVLAYVISAADRFFLAAFISPAAAGLYAPAYDLVLQAMAALMMVVNLGAFPLAVRAFEAGDPATRDSQFRAHLVLLSLVAFPVAAGIATLAPSVSGILGPRFAPTARELLPVLALAQLLAGLKGYYLDLSFQLGRATRLQLRDGGGGCHRERAAQRLAHPALRCSRCGIRYPRRLLRGAHPELRAGSAGDGAADPARGAGSHHGRHGGHVRGAAPPAKFRGGDRTRGTGGPRRGGLRAGPVAFGQRQSAAVARMSRALIVVEALLLGALILGAEWRRPIPRRWVDFLRATSAVYFICFVVLPLYMQVDDWRDLRGTAGCGCSSSASTARDSCTPGHWPSSATAPFSSGFISPGGTVVEGGGGGLRCRPDPRQDVIPAR